MSIDPSETTRRPKPALSCTTAGCDGDGRYAAPGRGHKSDCDYPTVSLGNPDAPWADLTRLLDATYGTDPTHAQYAFVTWVSGWRAETELRKAVTELAGAKPNGDTVIRATVRVLGIADMTATYVQQSALRKALEG